MADERVGVGLFSATDAIAKIRHVRGVVLLLQLNGNFDGRVAIAADLELAPAAEIHLPLRSIELRAAVGIVRIIRGPEPHFENEHSLAARLAIARILERD